MSDVENKTDSTAETPATNTAPYMKKADDKPAATKSNFIIPIILLLVSVIVIVATFYEDEYNTLIAELNTDNNENSETVIRSASEDAGANSTVNSNDSADVQSSATTTEVSSTEETTTEEVQAAVISEGSDKSTPVAADNKKDLAEDLPNSDRSIATTATDNGKKTSESAQVNQDKTAVQLANKTVAARAPASGHNAYQQPNGPYQKNRSLQAQNHHEMMQQRRQANEAEMQARRQQHEAAMKARHEKRAQFYETQKAVFQRTQNKRAEAAKKIQEIHQKIEILHDELHQLMQQPHVSYTAPASPMGQAAEQI